MYALYCLKWWATCSWSYLEPASDLLFAYRQYKYKNYIMAVLLTFFMYLPVATEGVRAAIKYCEGKKIDSFGDGAYCSKCLLESCGYDKEEDVNKVNPKTHEH